MFEFAGGFTLVRSANGLHFGLDRLEESLGARVLRRSLTLWQEHCSECAMPACYSTCSFYRPRSDYKCQRFDGGLRVIESNNQVAPAVVVKFGRWARLLGVGPSRLTKLPEATRHEVRALALARAAASIPATRGVSAPIRRRITNVMSRPRPWGPVDVDKLFLVIECDNPAPTPARLLLVCSILATAESKGSETFRIALDLPPGRSVRTLPVTSFVRPEQLGHKFAMELSPADDLEHPELAFGLLDIVELSNSPRAECLVRAEVKSPPDLASLPKLKCVVWDLDNTLWRGVLVEDGPEGVKLNEDAAAAVRALDAKGVLQSIASKNNYEDAIAALKKFDLDGYFLAPQISWNPKSEAILRLKDRLNIGLDTFALLDDQPFERAEVTSALAGVVAFDPHDLADFLAHPRLDIPVTEEAASRRSLYKAEEGREEAKTSFSGSYEDFLRSCGMCVQIDHLAAAHVERVYELVQRTNQLNISTCRYTRDEVVDMARGGSPRLAFVVHARDNFGTYGLIGFVVVDVDNSIVLDLMFSCRVQGKLVDDAFISWLYEAYIGRESGTLKARFRPNKKNAPAKQLLERLGFAPDAEEAGFQIWAKQSQGRALADIRRIISVDVPPNSTAP
jgi:FkbH-like protein